MRKLLLRLVLVLLVPILAVLVYPWVLIILPCAFIIAGCRGFEWAMDNMPPLAVARWIEPRV